MGVREGGNERYCENIIRCLAGSASRGEEYFAFSYRGAARTRIPDGRAHLTHLSLKRRSVVWQRAVELPLYSRRLDLDVLHVPFNFLPVFRCRKIVTIHDLPFLRVPETHLRVERARMLVLTRLAARLADHILTVSEFTKRDIIDAYRVDPARITVTPNAADRDVFRPLDNDARAAFRRARNLPFEYLLFVGTMQPRKNVALLVEAYARLRARGRLDHHLVLVGRKGWLYNPVFRAIQERGLNAVVHYVDSVDAPTLSGFYNTATAFVMPSRWESFGVPVIEAMSCGCPVVCSTAAALPEICGDAALPFDPGDPEELAAQLERIVDDNAMRRELVQRGFANAARFSWEESAARVRDVYHRV